MTTLKNTITTRAQLDNLAQEHGFLTYLLSDDLQACNLDDIKEVLQVSNNYLFISNHTLKKSDVELYHKIKREFEQVKSATTEPSCYDNIVVYAKDNEHVFYNHAMLEPCSYNSTGWDYCEQPSAHFIDINTASVSGGSFHEVEPSKLEYIGQAKRTIWTWGHAGACGNGGLYVKVTVNNYKLVTDREFIGWTVSYRINTQQGEYKFFVKKRDSHSNAMDVAFSTRKGLAEWLKERNLKVGKKLSMGTTHAIVGDFYEVAYMSTKEYKDNMPANAKEFLKTSNGRVTKAYMKGTTLYYCNPNVKDRYEENRILYR